MSQNITINISDSEPTTTGGNQEQASQDSLPTPMNIQQMEGGAALEIDIAPTPFQAEAEAGVADQGGVPEPGSQGEEPGLAYGEMSDSSEAEPTPFEDIQLALSDMEVGHPEPDMPLDFSPQNEPTPDEEPNVEGSVSKSAKGKK